MLLPVDSAEQHTPRPAQQMLDGPARMCSLTGSPPAALQGVWQALAGDPAALATLAEPQSRPAVRTELQGIHLCSTPDPHHPRSDSAAIKRARLHARVILKTHDITSGNQLVRGQLRSSPRGRQRRQGQLSYGALRPRTTITNLHNRAYALCPGAQAPSVDLGLLITHSILEPMQCHPSFPVLPRALVSSPQQG